MIKLTIFDLDGTLLNTFDDLLDSINSVALKYGFNTVKKDFFYSCIGNGQRFLIDRSLNGVNNDQYDSILNDYLQAYESRLLHKTRPFPEINYLLTELTKSNIKLGVLSNKKDNQVKQLVNYFFPEIKFEFVCGGEASNPLKPDPNSILNCLKNTDILPSETVMIGDSYQDALTANNANIKSISVLWGYQNEETIKKNSKPDFIVNNCTELLKLILSLND